jgi:hypothetical protein
MHGEVFHTFIKVSPLTEFMDQDVPERGHCRQFLHVVIGVGDEYNGSDIKFVRREALLRFVCRSPLR